MNVSQEDSEGVSLASASSSPTSSSLLPPLVPPKPPRSAFSPTSEDSYRLPGNSLAFRAPWATPPKATTDCQTLSGSIASPSSRSAAAVTAEEEEAAIAAAAALPIITSPDSEEEFSFQAARAARGKWGDTASYIERLLRDGGDLDSMDRSLLDYNGCSHFVAYSARTGGCGGGGAGGGSSGSTLIRSSPPSRGRSRDGSVTPSELTPINSPTSFRSSDMADEMMMDRPVSPHAVTNEILKRDLVVRFTEDRNSVSSSLAGSAAAANKANHHHSHHQHHQHHQGGGSAGVGAASESSETLVDSHEGDLQDDDKLLRAPSTNLYLYQEDMSERPRMAAAINSLANYSAAIPQGPSDPDAKPVEKANLGTFMGVFLPCVQNIFGVILFIRLTWVVGTAGAIEGFCIVLLGCSVTMLTAISMAAIATNGVVPAGGSYFMISRALGPEFGGAVGILFYLATTVAAAMYIIGAVEIMMTYLIGPAMSLFGPDISDDFVKFNNFRVYGTIVLMCLGCIVYIGVKFVNKFAGFALACVIFTILSIYVGIVVNIKGNNSSDFCIVGSRLVRQVNNCSKEFDTDLFHMFCKANETLGVVNDTSTLRATDYVCDEYFLRNEPRMEQGIKGLASGIFKENMPSKFHDGGDSISKDNYKEAEYNLGGSPKMGYITTDIYTSFTLLVGIFFPSCTGIMAGSNRSGDLADPQASIPIGTILAILATGFVYLSNVLLFAGTVDPLLLRDKFGESIGGSLVVGNIAWPHPKVVEIGALLSTIGAGLQSLTGAPRLLQAIAKDGIIPFLAPFQAQSAKGEPVRALGITIAICQIAVLIGNVDELAPLLSMFFLMCYGFVNLACALQTLLRTPNWRPRFKYYHWALSILGVTLSLAVMFMSSWYYALLAIGIAGIIYKYIEYRGAEKEWGDGLRGLALSAARFSLLRLEEGPPHTKNWRPQIMILSKLNSKYQVKHKRLFSLASQLKAGKGLCIGVTVLEGDFSKMYGEAQAAKLSIQQTIKEEGVKGFADIVVSANISNGVCHLIQTAGLGGMKPNTIILGWPNSWRKREEESCRVFVDAIRNAASAKMALLIPKGVQRYPETGDKVKGNIDIWWIVHDGGLLMLLPFLLKQHRTWKNCKLRIFSIAQADDNSIQMKKDLKTFLYHLRIEAEVEVVELNDSDISDYTYERTLIMEQRNEMIKEMNLSDKRKGKIVDAVMENIRAEAQGERITSPTNEERSPSKVTFAEGRSNGAEDDRTQEQRGASLSVPQLKRSDSTNARRMHTAVRLNEVIVGKSHEAKLVILNLPSPPKTMGQDKDSSYMEFLEVLTEGLERVLMVRGGGREVITIYS